jgi:hypothetical protein
MILFLHMGFAFMRNPDNWQVIQGKKYKKKSNKAEKCKKSSFFVRAALQRIPIPDFRNFERSPLPTTPQPFIFLRPRSDCV